MGKVEVFLIAWKRRSKNEVIDLWKANCVGYMMVHCALGSRKDDRFLKVESSPPPPNVYTIHFEDLVQL